jgi:hypothetical protein
MSDDSPAKLALPFGAIGFVGGWLTADMFGLRGDEIRWLLGIVTPISAAVLGACLTARIGGGRGEAARFSAEAGGRAGSWTRQPPLVASLLVLGAIVLAGIANGATIGMVLLPPVGAIVGAIYGAMCALPFIPALGLVLLAANRVGRARAGSIVAASDRRAVWTATATAIAVAGLAGRALFSRTVAPDLVLVAAGISCAVLAAMFVADGVALTRVRTMPPAELAADEVGAPLGLTAEELAARGSAGLDAGRREEIDLGLGDEVRVEVVTPTHAYRGVQRIARVVRGDREGAAAALRAGMMRAGVALAASAVLWGLRWG